MKISHMISALLSRHECQRAEGGMDEWPTDEHLKFSRI